MLKILAIPLLLLVHPVHVSITSLEHVTGTDSMKVFCRLYFDDFLRDYQTIDDDRDLATVFSSLPFPEDLLNKYFNSKVIIYVNNKLLTGKLLSVDMADNEISLNLYYKVEKKPRKIHVRNLILTSWFSDQENLTIVRAGSFEKGIKLTPGHIEETFLIK